MFSKPVVITAFALAAAGEVLEFLSALVGSRQAGGTRRGSWGGLLGGIAGAIAGTPLIPVPVLGTVIGACAGAFLGAAAFEWLGGRGLAPSVRSGGGAAMGRLFGTAAKLAVGVALWFLIAVAAFYP
jgi:hypothetical protein